MFKNINLLLLIMISLIFYPLKINAFPKNTEELISITEQIINSDIASQNIPPLNVQNYLSITEADLSLDYSDIVFVVPIGPVKPLQEREVIIIPRRYMIWHEVMNIINRDMAIAVTYSPVSGTLATYNTKKNDAFLQLEYNGGYYNANSILRDINTNSLWSQLYGLSIAGTYQGEGLNILACYWTTWEKARTFYNAKPNAKVLGLPRTEQRYGTDPYGNIADQNSFYHNDNLIFPVSNIDLRLGLKTQIIGLEIDSFFTAIDINFVREKKSVNFFLGGTPLIAVYDNKLGVVRIFKREVWTGKNPLIFTFENNNLIDLQTKSTWNLDGICISGNYLGAFMQEVFGIYSYWYSYAAHNPETETIPGNSMVPDSALETGNIDNPLSKGLDGDSEESGLGLPWNTGKSNYKK